MTLLPRWAVTGHWHVWRAAAKFTRLLINWKWLGSHLVVGHMKSANGHMWEERLFFKGPLFLICYSTFQWLWQLTKMSYLSFLCHPVEKKPLYTDQQTTAKVTDKRKLEVSFLLWNISTSVELLYLWILIIIIIIYGILDCVSEDTKNTLDYKHSL